MSLYLFGPELLPRNFRYPANFLTAVKENSLPEVEPWWFLCIHESNARFWLTTLRSQFPDRDLVPFAKLEDSDDLACFDGADTSGAPRVFYIHAYTSPGHEGRGEVPTYEAWLADAVETSREFAAEQDEPND
jgi:hypothetical protein